MSAYDLVLASASPRRSELLAREKIAFRCVPSHAEELPAGALPAEDLARENALLKARATAATEGDAIVLGADTVVVIDGKTLGKPRDLAEAREMMLALQGRWHEVVTGVALVHSGGEVVFAETTRLLFKSLSEDDISAYHCDVEVLDKAGGYAIQEEGERIIAQIEGCRDNVMGLPVTRVKAELAKLNSL